MNTPTSIKILPLTPPLEGQGEVSSSLFSFMQQAQNKTIVYKQNHKNVLNSERGFYITTGTKASNFVLLNAAHLPLYSSQLKQLSQASYQPMSVSFYNTYIRILMQ